MLPPRQISNTAQIIVALKKDSFFRASIQEEEEGGGGLTWNPLWEGGSLVVDITSLLPVDMLSPVLLRVTTSSHVFLVQIRGSSGQATSSIYFSGETSSSPTMYWIKGHMFLGNYTLECLSRNTYGNTSAVSHQINKIEQLG